MTGKRELGSVIRSAADDHGRALVGTYYGHPRHVFAAELFDELGDNPPGRFIADDLVAASLLDVRFGPRSVRRLLVGSGDASALLEQIPADRDLWADGVDLSRSSPAWELWNLLVSIDGVGRTRASKLLARKRPRLFPILDSVIVERLGLAHANSWAALREALEDDLTRSAIDALAPVGGFRKPTTLRLLDVVIWMRYSESTNARAARRNLSMTVADRPRVDRGSNA